MLSDQIPAYVDPWNHEPPRHALIGPSYWRDDYNADGSPRSWVNPSVPTPEGLIAPFSQNVFSTQAETGTVMPSSPNAFGTQAGTGTVMPSSPMDLGTQVGRVSTVLSSPNDLRTQAGRGSMVPSSPNDLRAQAGRSTLAPPKPARTPQGPSQLPSRTEGQPCMTPSVVWQPSRTSSINQNTPAIVLTPPTYHPNLEAFRAPGPRPPGIMDLVAEPPPRQTYEGPGASSLVIRGRTPSVPATEGAVRGKKRQCSSPAPDDTSKRLRGSGFVSDPFKCTR
ncbi:leucine-rich repeat extensin-like protein 5 [Quercus suber]|uniref:leucine-rich repeat extensin-like protein 5 n=1 Tax=Quercus suber TaxID=58331 RepID=UPI000D2674D2|nr:hypothetical protein CFP56_74977 [Quercus suber]